MPERGRSTEVRDGKVKRSMFRSRSRSRKTKSDEEKTKQPRWKKVVKGMSRKGLKGSSRTNSVASESLEPTKMEVRQVVPPAPKADAVKAQPTKAPAPSLQLVLLLMEPLTRRFELLQLEFDSARARVVDILAQVPLSVTEEAIREQDFDGVLCDTGEVMTQGKLLVEFCTEKQVLVALPKGLDVEECNRLARPILSDFQVSKMLTDSGFDLSKWEDTRERGLPEEADIEVSQNSGGFAGFSIVAIIALLAIVLQSAHKYLQSPISAGSHLIPGSIRSRCGLLGYLPKLDFVECENAFLEVDHDGTVSIYNEDRQRAAFLAGEQCKTEDCVDGIEFRNNGMVYIGGKRVKTARVYQDSFDLSGWPFAESPKLNTKRVKL